MKQKLLLFCLLSFFTINENYSQNGKLNKAKQSLKTSSKTTTSSKKSTRNTRYRRNINQNRSFAHFFLVDLLGGVFMYTAYAAAIESPWERNANMSDAEIAHYPYEKPSHGNFIYTNSTNYNITRFDIYNRFLWESSNLYGNNFGVDFRFFKRFSANLDFVAFNENINNTNDSFLLYSALLKYHRVRTQKIDAWFGLGATYVASDVNRTGFTFGLGTEWFIKKPISLLAEYRTTRINSEPVNNGKLLLKYHIKNYRISAGYENYKLGISRINAFSIGAEVSF